MYAPSFILDVLASSVHDENTDEYLTKVGHGDVVRATTRGTATRCVQPRGAQ